MLYKSEGHVVFVKDDLTSGKSIVYVSQ